MGEISPGEHVSKVVNIMFFLMICCAPAAAFSQDKSESSQAKMDIAVRSASASFEAGKFKIAAKKFAEAFGYFKDYNLKKNEMVSWFKAGDCAAAIDAGGLYLGGNRDITKFDRGDVKMVSVRCSLIAAKKFLNLGRFEKCSQHLNEAESLIAADSYPPITGSNESGEIQSMRDQISAVKKNETPPVEPGSTSVVGPILAISGGVIAVGGGVFLFLSKQKESEFTCSKNVEEASCDNPSATFTERKFEDAKQSATMLNTVGWIGVAGGATLSAIGVYLWATEDAVSSDSAKFYINPIRKHVGFEFVF